MYSNIYRESVTLSKIAYAIEMYSDICVPLIDAMVDYYGFIEDMSSI